MTSSQRSADPPGTDARNLKDPVKRIAIAIVAAFCAVLAGAQSADAATEGYAWAHAAGHWPRIYVENHTDLHWSITASVRAWGSGLRIGSCRAGAGCIRITSPARGHAAPLGQSFIYAAGTRITKVDIELNASDEAQPPAVRKVAAEHELGHALGLAHDTSYRGIMGPTAFGYDYINSYARKELTGIYGA